MISRASPFVRVLALLAFSVLAGCTTDTTPSANLTAVLEPTEADKAENKASDDTAAEETIAEAKDAPKAETETAAAVPPKPVNEKSTEKTPPKEVAEAGDDTAETTTTAALAPEKKAKPNPFQGFWKKSNKPRRPKASIGGDKEVRTASLQRKRKRAPRVTITSRKGSISRTSRGSTSSLPGVEVKTIFGIDEEGDADETDSLGNSLGTNDEATRVAALTNMARRGSHGLILQRPDVKVGCFPPKLVAILKKVERKFGRTPIVTSGYRSPRHNRRAGGARRSQHMQCRAADIQVKGVSKFTLAKFLRSLPGRGGVGTYCHMNPVHIDIGKERAWHHCRRRRKA